MQANELSPRQEKVLQILAEKNDWIKSADIAARLGVTTRTIRSDLRALSAALAQSGARVVSSHTKGYRLQGGESLSRISEPPARRSLPILPEERVAYILKKLIAGKRRLDFYSLAEELLVSESTLENDLKKVKRYIKTCGCELELVRKSQFIHLDGGEREQRLLFGRLLFAEADGKFFNLTDYEAYFPALKEIQQISLSTLRRYDYALHEMGVLNLIVHIAVTIDRISHDKLIHRAPTPDAETRAVEYRIAEDLCGQFKARFRVDFPPQEILYLSYLISVKKILKNTCKHKNDLGAMVSPETLAVTEKMIGDAAEEFALPLAEDDALQIGLALHVAALRERAERRAMIRNPLLGNLKRKYPFIFEISVYMAASFARATGHMICEDEIGFITLHLGAAIERLGRRRTAVKKVALVCPSGSTSTELLLTKLAERYPRKIEIIGVFSFYALPDIQSAAPDFIFTTVDFQHDLPVPTIVISPFLDAADIETINRRLDLEESAVQKQKLRLDMEQYFRQDLYYENPKAADRFSLLEQMAGGLAAAGFVPPSYKDSVLRREQISSTSFNQWIAIPHALEMNAYQTAVAVARFDKPMAWGIHHIRLVLLFAIKFGERKKLDHLYQTILRMIDHPEVMLRLVNARDFSQFKERILDWRT